MRRKRSRGTGYLGTDKGLRELYPRLGLDNSSRSTSDEPHNRRKPRVGSTGTPELADSAVTNVKISDVNASKIDAGTLAGARLPNNVVTTGADNRIGGGVLPTNVVTGSHNGNPGKLGVGDIGGMPDFSTFLKSVPKAYVTQNELNQILKKYKKA